MIEEKKNFTGRLIGFRVQSKISQINVILKPIESFMGTILAFLSFRLILLYIKQKK